MRPTGSRSRRATSRKAGLDVTLENSKGSGDSIAKVDTGRADAGLADTVAVLAATARGAKVKMVGMVFDKTPLNFFSRKDNALQQARRTSRARPSARRPATASARPGRRSRSCTSIDESKVTWVNIEPTAKIAALAEKRVDVVGDYTTGLPFYEKAMGAGNVGDDAVGRHRLRHLQHVDHGEREDDEGAAEGAEGVPRGGLHGLARRDEPTRRRARDLQEARARDRPRDHRAEHDARAST